VGNFLPDNTDYMILRKPQLFLIVFFYQLDDLSQPGLY